MYMGDGPSGPARGPKGPHRPEETLCLGQAAGKVKGGVPPGRRPGAVGEAAHFGSPIFASASLAFRSTMFCSTSGSGLR